MHTTIACVKYFTCWTVRF